MKRYLSILFSAACLLLFYACGPSGDHTHEEEDTEETVSITVSPLTDSPQFPDAALSLDGDPTVDGNKLSVAFNVEGYQLGEQTSNAGQNGLANSGKGQHIHFIVDNGPYAAFYEPAAEKELEPGNHIVMAFLSRSYHESVKNATSYQVFQVQAGGEGEAADLSGPHMFYSRPKGEYKGDDTKKLMLDFFLFNCNLSADGYKVKATISGEGYEHSETFTTWQPYVIEGLPLGEVNIKLELLDAEDGLVDSPFNPVLRSVTLSPADES